MKLKEWLEELNTLVKNHPEAMELDVITARDDEGNGYNHVIYTPALGEFDDGEWTETGATGANSICLN